MKRFLLVLALVTETAFAAGTSYYTTSHVTITGPSDWGTLQPSTAYETDYAVSASASALVSVTISGDPEFTIDGSACPGVISCTAPVNFAADVGGDYVATIKGTSSSRYKVHGSSTAHPIQAHVVGANYALAGIDNGDATATFTLTSTGETDLVGPTFVASTYNDVGTATITANTCGDLVPSGTTCAVAVAFLPSGSDPGPYGYVLLQAYGNTRQQAPARVTLVLPPAPE